MVTVHAWNWQRWGPGQKKCPGSHLCQLRTAGHLFYWRPPASSSGGMSGQAVLIALHIWTLVTNSDFILFIYLYSGFYSRNIKYIRVRDYPCAYWQIQWGQPQISSACVGQGSGKSPLCHWSFLSDLGLVAFPQPNLPQRVVGRKKIGEWQVYCVSMERPGERANDIYMGGWNH